jgi:hypothetical protein
MNFGALSDWLEQAKMLGLAVDCGRYLGLELTLFRSQPVLNAGITRIEVVDHLTQGRARHRRSSVSACEGPEQCRNPDDGQSSSL